MTQQPFTFPYPELGDTVRSIDQGCRVCVHQTYCPAMYWFRRGGDSRGFKQEPITDKNMGRACTSWSNNPKDKLPGIPNARDLAEMNYMYNQGIGSEANRNGITAAVTGTSRRP
jgi:hypothetical protein